MMGWLWTALGTAMAGVPASCPGEDTASLISARVESAKRTFLELDTAGFEASMADLDGLVPCLHTVVAPPEAGGVHLVHGLEAFVARDRPTTRAILQARQPADPGFDLEGWLPTAHPLPFASDYAEDAAPEAPTPLEFDRTTSVWVDGVKQDHMLKTQPAVLQHGKEGSAVSTVLWLPDQPLPEGISFLEPRLTARQLRRL